MAGIHDTDFDHTPGYPITDALGRDLIIGDTVAHIARVASRIRVSKRTILEIDRNAGTMTISPCKSRFRTTKPGKNVKGCNVLRLYDGEISKLENRVRILESKIRHDDRSFLKVASEGTWPISRWPKETCRGCRDGFHS